MLCGTHRHVCRSKPLDNREERANLPGIGQFLHRCEVIILMVQRRVEEASGPDTIATSIRDLNNVVRNVERLGTYERLRGSMLRVTLSVNALLATINTYTM